MDYRAAAAGLILTLGCSNTPIEQSTPTAPLAAVKAEAASLELSPRMLRRFKPLRPLLADQAASKEIVDLGRMLYFEPRLSASHQISCNTCHPLASYGATPDVVSIGVHGQKGTRNAPTTYNAAGHFAQFWDGRAANVEEQAKGPIINPLEMGMQPASAVAVLETIPGYVEAFKAAWPDDPKPLTWNHVGQSIGAFERGLVTPSRWDKFLNGDKDALSQAEKEGVRTFINSDCLTCHTGELMGAQTYEKVGRIEAWPNQQDKGRGAITANERDEMIFKVPSLRNVSKTGPYFHDGSAKTLDEAVKMMGRYQPGEELSDEESGSIIAFLGALTGTVPEAYIVAPTLPADGPRTPKASKK